MCSLMAFSLRIECHTSKDNLFYHVLGTAVNNLDIVKVKFEIVLNGMLG